MPQKGHIAKFCKSAYQCKRYEILHYRQIEKEKSQVFHACQGNYDATNSLLQGVKTKLQRWINYMANGFNVIEY